MKVRYTLRAADLLSQFMQHPGRGAPYSNRTLADAAGCSHSLIHRLVTGKQEDVDMQVAHAIAEAVGVAILVLFAPPASPNPIEPATE